MQGTILTGIYIRKSILSAPLIFDGGGGANTAENI